MEITIESNGLSPQFTLTCISTGGPATNVTWTRDYSDTVTEGTETMLDDRLTSQYSHTLTVNETSLYHLSFTYSCEVSNNKPSSATVYAEVYTYTGHGMLMHLYMTHGLHNNSRSAIIVMLFCFSVDELNHLMYVTCIIYSSQNAHTCI